MLSIWKEKSQEPAKSDRWGGSAIKSPHFCCVTLISNRNFTKVQALGIWTCRSGGCQNPTKRVCKSQVAYSSKHTCTGILVDHVFKTSRQAITINVNGIYLSLSMYKLYMSYVKYNEDKINCINSISGSIRLIRREDNSNKKTLIYIPYISLHHQLSISN